ncbi:MAG: T9SS type A sorting domain-containing protein [Bacteroidota bacterium]
MKKDSAIHFNITRAIDPSYFRALGNYFIRIFWKDSTTPDLSVELYDFNGALHVRQIVHCADHNRLPFVVQRRKDSAWAIVTATRHGIHATLLDRWLGIVVADTLVSATIDSVASPSATFRNDTLFAVWQDFRNGPADIYGNVIRLPLAPVAPHHPGDSIVNAHVNDTLTARHNQDSLPPSIDSITFDHISIYPNPARDIVNIDITTRMNDDADITIFNTLGQIIRSVHRDAEPSWRHRFSIATGNIPAGAYFLRYRVGIISGARLLQIKP